MRSLLALCLILSAAAVSAGSQVYEVGDIKIFNVYSTEMPPETKSAVVYLTIENAGGADDQLLSLTTPVGERVELHKNVHTHNGIEMKRLGLLTIRPGATVSLRPTEDHLMIISVAKRVSAGGSFPLTLNFEKAGKVEVEVPVKRLGDD